MADRQCSSLRSRAAPFRDLLIAASLKQIPGGGLGGAQALPRSIDRGLIEASQGHCRLACRARSFRDLLIAASLKQLSLLPLSLRAISFRDLLIAASLKRMAFETLASSSFVFRDLLIAASLKRACRTGGNPLPLSPSAIY